MVKDAETTYQRHQNDSCELSRRLSILEHNQRQKDLKHLQKQKLLKYKLRFLKQQETLNKLKGIVSGQNVSASSQLDGTETDDDSDFVLSDESEEESSEEEDEEDIASSRQTRSKAIPAAIPGTSKEARLDLSRQKLVESFQHFISQSNIAETELSDPTTIFTQFLQNQKGKTTKGIPLKTTKKSTKKPSVSESSHYQSAIETDQGSML